VAAKKQITNSDDLLSFGAENPKNVLALLFDHRSGVAATIKAIVPFLGGQVLGKLDCERSRFHSKHDSCRNQAIVLITPAAGVLS